MKIHHGVLSASIILLAFASIPSGADA